MDFGDTVSTPLGQGIVAGFEDYWRRVGVRTHGNPGDETGIYWFYPRDGVRLVRQANPSREQLIEHVRILREALEASLKYTIAHHLVSEAIAEEKGYAQLPTEPASIKIARAALESTKGA